MSLQMTHAAAPFTVDSALGRDMQIARLRSEMVVPDPRGPYWLETSLNYCLAMSCESYSRFVSPWKTRDLVMARTAFWKACREAGVSTTILGDISNRSRSAVVVMLERHSADDGVVFHALHRIAKAAIKRAMEAMQ